MTNNFICNFFALFRLGVKYKDLVYTTRTLSEKDENISKKRDENNKI